MSEMYSVKYSEGYGSTFFRSSEVDYFQKRSPLKEILFDFQQIIFSIFLSSSYKFSVIAVH